MQETNRLTLQNVKIQYFSKKTLNAYIYVSVDNDRMKIQQEI